MRITVLETTKREIELPKYFETKHGAKIMLTGDGKSYVKVWDMEYSPVLELYPRIEVSSVSALEFYLAGANITPISEAAFKAAFIKVSVMMDEILNN